MPTSRPTEVAPSPAAAIECTAFDLAHETQAHMHLHHASERPDDGAYGLSGSMALGGVRYDRGDWHQPSPGAALVASRGDRLHVTAFIEDDDGPLCIETATLEAAPFSPRAITPDPSSRVLLAADIEHPRRAEFRPPDEPGEWVVRVRLTFATDPGPTYQESFFRLRLDVPPPEVGGKAMAIGCERPGEHPVGAFLSVDDGERIEAAGGGFTWRRTAGSGPAPIGPLVKAKTGARLLVEVEDRVCAGWWSIQIAPLPAFEWQDQEPITDLVPPRGGYETPPGEANRFRLDAIPPGDWVLGAFLEFANERDDVMGQRTLFWHVVVDGEGP